MYDLWNNNSLHDGDLIKQKYFSEDFNGKLLTPDLSKLQLETLHDEALNLYKSYFDKKSSDYIECSEKISLRLKELLSDGRYSVAKLRTTEPLYEAYDYAFGILENEWLPPFFYSNEVCNII